MNARPRTTRRARSAGLAAALLFWLVATGWASDDFAALRWSQQVELPEVTEPTLLALPLDSHFFAATRADYPDVRLSDGKGYDVAFVIRDTPNLKERRIRKTWTAQQVAAKPLESGGLEILLALDEKSPQPQGLTIITPLRDFEHRVRVFSSADGQDWQPVSTPEAIFDYARFVDARNTSVRFDDNTHRHFKLVIDDVTDEQASRLLELTRHLRGAEELERDERTTIDRRPFRVDRIEFYRDDVEIGSAGSATLVYPTRDLKVSQDAKNKRTLVEFRTDREPLTLVRLMTGATNFSRMAALEAPLGRENDTWQPIAGGTLARFSIGRLHKNDVELGFTEQRHEGYRLVIENRDSPPLEIEGIEAEGPNYQLAFLANPGQHLTLAYGSPEVKAGNYDTAALRASLAEGFTPEFVKLGEVTENTAAPAAVAFRWAELLEDPRVVIGVIAVLVGALGWGLYRASSRLESAPRE